MLLFNKQNYLLTLLFGVFIASCAFEPAWIAKDNKIKILWQRVDLREPITSNEFRFKPLFSVKDWGCQGCRVFLEYELFTETKRTALSFDGRHRIRILGEVKFSLLHSEKDTICEFERKG